MNNSGVKKWRQVVAAGMAGALVLLLLLSVLFGSWTLRLMDRVKQLERDNKSLQVGAMNVDMTLEEPEGGDASGSGDGSAAEGPPPEAPAKQEEVLEYQLLYPDLKATAVPKTDDNTQKIVYLTFDDGPSENTGEILEVLKAYGAHATFFVSAQFGDEAFRGKMYNQILDEGNMIGLHSSSHNYKEIYASEEAFLADMDYIYQEVYQATGFRADMMRFPGGSVNSYNGAYFYSLIAEITRRGFTYHDWVVSSGDADSNTVPASAIVKAVVDGCEKRKKSVVLLHDTDAKDTTVKALPEILETLGEAGYEFRALDSSVAPYHFAYPDQAP